MYVSDFPLECQGLTRRFGERKALDQLDLQLPAGTLTTLVGNNGAGKTTLIRILSTLLNPTEGKAFVGGWDVVSHPHKVQSLIGWAPSEDRSFFARLSVWQNLEFFGALYGISSQPAKSRVWPLLEILDLHHRLQTRFSELSAGMRQGLGLVRALIHDPPIFLLDEPTRSLSPDLATKVGAYFRHLASDRQRTILWATHQLSEAVKLGDEVVVLQNGRMVAKRLTAALAADEDWFHPLMATGPT